MGANAAAVRCDFCTKAKTEIRHPPPWPNGSWCALPRYVQECVGCGPRGRRSARILDVPCRAPGAALCLMARVPAAARAQLRQLLALHPRPASLPPARAGLFPTASRPPWEVWAAGGQFFSCMHWLGMGDRDLPRLEWRGLGAVVGVLVVMGCLALGLPGLPPPPPTPLACALLPARALFHGIESRNYECVLGVRLCGWVEGGMQKSGRAWVQVPHPPPSLLHTTCPRARPRTPT